ncbi:hypothetical protein AV641_15675 [Pseudomonas fragi]|jgi:hypothetical protein|nr:hypothetical protein AV641_15675 [Pseudomonas fragi]
MVHSLMAGRLDLEALEDTDECRRLIAVRLFLLGVLDQAAAAGVVSIVLALWKAKRLRTR